MGLDRLLIDKETVIENKTTPNKDIPTMASKEKNTENQSSNKRGIILSWSTDQVLEWIESTSLKNIITTSKLLEIKS